MKPNQIINKLLGCFKTNIDPLTVDRGITVIPWLKGGVGVGKTAVVRESAKLIADDQGLEFVDLHQQKAFGMGWRDLTDKQFGFLSFNVSNYDVLDIGVAIATGYVAIIGALGNGVLVRPALTTGIALRVVHIVVRCTLTGRWPTGPKVVVTLFHGAQVTGTPEADSIGRSGATRCHSVCTYAWG